MTPSQRREVESLASDACQGRLADGDQARLEQLLAADEEARQVWLDFCRLHIELGLHTRADAITRRLHSRISSQENGEITAAADADPGRSARFTPRRGAPSTRSRSRGAVVALVAIAASLLALFALPSSPPKTPHLAANKPSEQAPKRRPEVVALLTTPPVGDLVTSERVVLAGEQIAVSGGKTDVKMIGGANLFLDGPATLRFESASHVRLLSGSLSANLPEWAKGFIVDTKAMRLIDLGTTFAVTAESGTIAEAEVLEGLVKVQPRMARSSP